MPHKRAISALRTYTNHALAFRKPDLGKLVWKTSLRYKTPLDFSQKLVFCRKCHRVGVGKVRVRHKQLIRHCLFCKHMWRVPLHTRSNTSSAK